MTLLSAYLVLLHRYTRQSNLIVGVPFTNRRQPESQDVMGCFVNILPLSIDVSGGPSFRDVAQRVRQAMLEAHRRQEVTLERIVERLKLSRDLSHNPLYQAGFTFAPPAELALSGLEVEPLSVHHGFVPARSVRHAVGGGEGGAGPDRVQHGPLRADHDGAVRSSHYRTLLASIAQDADRPIASLAILPGPERMRLIREWNATEMPCPNVCGIHQLVETQTRKTPEAIAVVFEGDQLTYGELNRRANQLAHSLQALGVGPDVLVGVYMERSLELPIALLGILKAGGAYLPVDPEFPKERIDYVLDHSQVSVLLTQERLKEQLGQIGATMICLDTGWQPISREDRAGSAERDPPRESGVRDLYVGIDGQAQRGGDSPRRRRQPPGQHAAGARFDGARCSAGRHNLLL